MTTLGMMAQGFEIFDMEGGKVEVEGRVVGGKSEAKEAERL